MYYTDPGHGWLRVNVKCKILSELLNEISNCSFYNGKFVYLEEDDDAGLYLNKLKEMGIEYEIKQKHANSDSSIRTYQSILALKLKRIEEKYQEN